MAPLLDNAQLRIASPRDQARILQKAAQEGPWRPVSKHLLDAVAAGSIPPNIFHIWLSVCKDVEAVVFALRQDTSVLVRHVAIARFEKALRTDEGFSAAWNATGGLSGVLDLMASMSVHEVASFCRGLGQTGTAPAAASARQSAMSQLFEALNHRGPVPNPDKRPLMDYYQPLLLACKTDTAMQWHDRRNQPWDNKTYRLHRTACQEKALQSMFAPANEDKRERFDRYRALFEQDKAFALEVLERLAQDEKALEKNEHACISVLAKPLLRRNRQAQRSDAHTRVKRALSLVLQCIQRKPKMVSSINFHPHGIVAWTIQAWVRARNRRAVIEEQLVRMLGLMHGVNSGSLEDIARLVAEVPLALRYRLLKLFLLHATGIGLDIDAPEKDLGAWSCSKLGLHSGSRGCLWPRHLFNAILPPRQALQLFNLLQAANPDGEFIAMGSGYAESTTILQSIKPDSSGRFSDPDLVAAYLRYRVALQKGDGADESRLEEATNLINERKKQSVISREQTDRVKWAKSAMKLSFATGSLDLIQETLIWLRRFNRESDTIAELYSKYALRVDEVFDLLAGIAPTGSAAEYQTLAWTRDNVKKANEILSGLLETMVMALREPSFNAYHWRALQDILSMAILRRLENAEKYQERTGCSDEDLLTAVLQPTVNFLLEAERFGIKKANERLGMGDDGGLLKEYSLVNPRTSTRLALDQLAKGRNEIWQQHRIAMTPATATLEAPWPKGLPVQKLCPVELQKVQGPLNMPYLESRAKDVVLAGDAVWKPIPESDEVREAIGPFVDCFQYALWVFLKEAKDDQDRDSRLRRAWEHATTQLTGDRMSPDEANRFWRQQFLDWSSYIPDRLMANDLKKVGLATVPRAELPKFPDDDGGSGPHEWDPCPSHKAIGYKSRPLKATCLDAMLTFNIYYVPYHYSGAAHNPPSFQVPDPVVPEQRMPGIWGLGENPRRLSHLQRDAMAAAAVEYVNSTYGSDVSIFGKPFPHSEDARYPAFYLDQDFLERVSKYGSNYQITPIHSILPIITDRWYCLPVQILVHLAEAVMTRLAKDPDQQEPEIRETLVKIIKFLTRSDQPAAACSFVQNVVLQQQDDSSWHRQLFTVRFFRSLTALQASSFFGDLSSQIQERLGQPVIDESPQTQGTETRGSTRGRTRGRARGMTRVMTRGMTQGTTREETPADKAADKKRPLIKVTIVKMLAQVLRGADYCDRARACTVLINLFRGSPQLDIRVAAFESLTYMLGKEDEQLDETVFAFAQQDVVPAAGSLNERCPTTEKEWRAAESDDGALPEIYEPQGQTCGPLMGAILSARMQFPMGSAERRRWIESVAIPAFELSAANNQRFCVLFARRQGFALPDGLLPAIPAKPDTLLKHFEAVEPEFLKLDFLDAISGYVRAQLDPHPILRAVTKEVDEDAQLRKSDGGLHWLQLWDWEYKKYGSNRPPRGMQETFRLLHADLSKTVASSDVMVKAVQDFARDTFALLLSQSRVNELWLMWECLDLDGTGLKNWNRQVLPLFQFFVARIDALRTPQWQRDPQRQPVWLPNTFALKTQVLCRRYKVYMYDISTDKVDEFAAEVLSLIGELVSAATLYHKPDNWPLLKEKVTMSISTARSLALGLRFAEPALSPEEKPALRDVLRMELADALFRRGAGCEDADDVERVGVVLKGWAASPFEDLRLMAYDTAQARRRQFARDADPTRRGVEWDEGGDDQAPSPVSYEDTNYPNYLATI